MIKRSDNYAKLVRYDVFNSLRKHGYLYKEIAQIYGVSKERVRQILKEGKPKEFHILPEYMRKKGIDYTRMKVRFRDDFTCQDCGDVRTPDQAKENGKRLFDIHHLNGLCGKLSKTYDRVESMDGLITLCHKCHFNRPDHSRKIKTLST